MWGLVWTALGTAVFALMGILGWAVACGVLWLVIALDLAVIVRRIRQGPHYQPGRDVPPYWPPE
ncbi:membrane protein [Streptomyces sp. F-3]|nr:membrane protein [Streptomyces sp. F-3]